MQSFKFSQTKYQSWKKLNKALNRLMCPVNLLINQRITVLEACDLLIRHPEFKDDLDYQYMLWLMIIKTKEEPETHKQLLNLSTSDLVYPFMRETLKH